MLPWILLATADAPQGGTLRLLRRGDEFSIRLEGGNELMNSRLGGSEEALATLNTGLELHPDDPKLIVTARGVGYRLLAG